MNLVTDGVLDILTMLHDDCKTQVMGLTPEQLDWRPGEEQNSLAVLVMHIAGAEKFWIGDVVMGDSSERDRPAEFATTDVDEARLIESLDGSLDYLRGALDRLSVENLSRMISSPRDGRQYSVAWALTHIVQHTALHLGHMQITRHWLLSDV